MMSDDVILCSHILHALVYMTVHHYVIMMQLKISASNIAMYERKY